MSKAIKELIQALKSRDEFKKDMAALCLLDTGEEDVGQLLETVNDPSPEVRGLSIKVLELLTGEKCLPVLVEKLGDRNQRVRHFVDKALDKYKFYDALIDAYLEQLKSFNNDLVIEILVRLEEYNISKVAKAIIPLLGHRDYFVKTRAFITLCRIPNRVITQDLLDYFQREQDEEFRLRCLEALHYIGDQKAVPVLSQHLGAVNKAVNRGLIWTIGSIGGWDALKILLAYGVKNRSNKEVNMKLVAEAIGLALVPLRMMARPLDYLMEKDNDIREFIYQWRVFYVLEPKYYVFPSPAYFHRQVEKRGFNYRDYEKLFRSPGEKKKHRY